MAMSHAIEHYLRAHELPFETIARPPGPRHPEVSEDLTPILPDQVAKSVLLQDDDGYIIAVLPSTRNLDLQKLRQTLDRMVHLAVEREVEDLFVDCDAGSVPAIGNAYDVTTVVDEALLEQSQVYFAAGDRTALIRMKGRDFRALMADRPRGRFSYRI